jgi:hypothetical protein
MNHRIFFRGARKLAMGIIAAIVMVMCVCASAQDAQKAEKEIWDSTKDAVFKIADEGKWDVYLSGYARHFNHRGDYNLNEKVWGGGVGKTYRNPKGNEESLYLMATTDSLDNMQYMAGYAYHWIFPVSDTGLEFGAGASLFIIKREDWFHGRPFPGALPMFSFGTRKAKLMATYIPELPHENRKSSAVLFIFGRVEFD